jgi:hypothetical protein
MRTHHREKLGGEFSYPVGLAELQESLEGVPQARDLEVSFVRYPGTSMSRFRQIGAPSQARGIFVDALASPQAASGDLDGSAMRRTRGPHSTASSHRYTDAPSGPSLVMGMPATRSVPSGFSDS